jgi:acyl-CoA thioester hydrolase
MVTEHNVEVAIRWSDMDANGHVNNVQYFRLLEEARARFFTTAADPSQFLERGIVVASQRLDYLRPLVYRAEPIRVGLSVTEIGRSSFTLDCRIFDQVEHTDDLIYASGAVVIVAFNEQGQRTRHLEPDERQWLANAREVVTPS